MKTLYTHADLVLFENGKINVKKNACLGVENDVFCYIGEAVPAEGYDTVRDMTGHVILPGLYNCHTHAAMVLLRGVGSDLPLQQWLFDRVFPIEAKLTPEMIRTGSELALLEMIAGGTVSFSDMYFCPEQTAEAVLASGMRANLNRPVQDMVFEDGAAAEKRVNEALALFKAYDGAGNGRLKIDFSIHAEYTCNEKTTARFSALCAENGGNMHIHLSETASEHEACKQKYGKTPARWFYDLGAFDSAAFAAHCVMLEEDDIRLLKEKNVSVAHNPTSNLKLGSGFAPVPAFLAAGLNVTLGTDGAASNNNLNIFEEMHLAGIMHKGYLKDASVLPAGEIVKMATLNGALLQRRENCGEIRTGYQADFIAVDTRKPHLTPNLDVPALLVYAAGASDVALTVCAGKTLYEKGEFKTLDRERILYEAGAAVKELYA